MIGRTISHYRIVGKLGEGGMGVVYKAIDTRLERPVALKFLNAASLADADRVNRFIEEAKAASALNHPNITAVYDIETHGDESFLVDGVRRRQDAARAHRAKRPVARRCRAVSHAGG